VQRIGCVNNLDNCDREIAVLVNGIIGAEN